MHLSLKISLLFLCSLFVIGQVPKELFAKEPDKHLVINEIYYNAFNEPSEEWLEVYNPTDGELSLKDWSLVEGSHTFVFPDITILSQDYLVIAHSLAAFRNLFQVEATFEWSNMALNNTGDTIYLLNDNQEIIDEVTYPSKSAEEGNSIERLPKGNDNDDFNQDFIEQPNPSPFFGLPSRIILELTDLGESYITISWNECLESDFAEYEIYLSENGFDWSIVDSIDLRGTTNYLVENLIPGKQYFFKIRNINLENGFWDSNIVSATTKIEYSKDIIINEILPRPSRGANFEFIELYNQSNQAVDISGWILDDIEGGSSPYAIPKGTIIEARGYSVFYKQQTKIALNDDGDIARLLWPNGEKRSESEKYSHASVDASWSKSGNSWYFSTTVTPGAANIITKIEEINDDEIFEGSIEEIKTRPKNSWVKFSGIVTAVPGLFGKRVIYVQDENSGIRIYFYKALWPNIKIGDKIIIIGKISSSAGEYQVRIYDPSAIIILETSKPPPARSVKIKDISDYLIGRLIKISGIVVRVSGSTIWISDGKNEIRIYLYSSTGIKKLGLKKGDKIVVSGILSKTSAGYRLLPRKREEIKTVKYSSKKVAAASTDNVFKALDHANRAGTDYRGDKIFSVKNFITLKIIGVVGLSFSLLALIILLILVNLEKRNAKNHQIN